jgi:hypothetical protein
MLTFSELEAKAGEVAKSVEVHALGIFHHGVADFAREVQAEWAKVKSDALVVVKDATPEVQTAVQAALETAEKALLVVIEARLA